MSGVAAALQLSVYACYALGQAATLTPHQLSRNCYRATKRVTAISSVERSLQRWVCNNNHLLLGKGNL